MEIKLVFVQSNEDDCSRLARLLGSLEQHDYHFVILPPDTRILTKDEVVELLRRAMS